MPRLLAIVVGLIVVAPAAAQDMALSQVLIDGEGWHAVAGGYRTVTGLAADRDGNIYVADPDRKRLDRIDAAGKVSAVAQVHDAVSGVYVAPDGTLYACQPLRRRIVAVTPKGEEAVVDNIDAWSLVVTTDRRLYCTVPRDLAVYRIDLAGDRKRHRVDGAVVPPMALTLWPDEGTLVIGYPTSAYLWACRIDKDGNLSARDRYYALRLPHGSKSGGVAQLIEDVQRRLYAATAIGVQIYDPTGRMSGVLLKPERADVTAVAIGGPGRATLYIGCGGKVYARKIKPRGAFPR